MLDAPAITAMTGIRRVSKSVLLRQFAASLRGERRVVRDTYPRVLLSLDPHQPADLQGVRHQSLTDFLRGASADDGR